MRRLADDSAFSCHADCSTRVVSGDHSARDMCGSKDLNGTSRARLELVLKDDKPKESETALGLLPVHPAMSTEFLNKLRASTYRFIL